MENQDLINKLEKISNELQKVKEKEQNIENIFNGFDCKVCSYNGVVCFICRKIQGELCI